jgi:hypothetical protein
MRYLLLVCWDAEKMDAQPEPEPEPEPEPIDTPDRTIFRRGTFGSRATRHP